MPAQEYRIPIPTLSENFRMRVPPKRPVFGILARQLGEVIDLLNSPQASSIPPAVRESVKDCLGSAIDSLFRGDVHSARNALTAVAHLITKAFGRELPVALPAGVSRAAAAATLTNKYYDPNKDTDLWDTISLQVAIPGMETVTLTGSAAVKASAPPVKSTDQLLSMWLNRLAGIADSLELGRIFQADRDIISQEYVALTDGFNESPDNERQKNVSATINTQLGLTGNASTTYDYAMLVWFFAMAVAAYALDNAIRRVDYPECERLVGMMYDIIVKTKGLITEMLRNIDAAQAAARENVVKNSSHVWDLILGCIQGGTLTKFQDSLDDWYGAKKYIVLAGCALINVPIIIASSGLALIPAVAGFVWCFISGMVGGVVGVAFDIARCVLGF